MSSHGREREGLRAENEIDTARNGRRRRGREVVIAAVLGDAEVTKGVQVTVMASDKEEAANQVRCEYHTKRGWQRAVNRVSDRG